jgi:predicted hydrolase (HD superfamily)
MATETTKPATTKPAKEKKAAVAPVARVSEQLKRAALAGKINREELQTVANLAQALQTFLATP